MKILKCSLLVLLLACTLGFAADSAVPERAKRERAQLVELASRHNASADWMLALPNRGAGRVFTADLMKALVRTNGQPVALIAELEDVSESNGVHTAHFEMLPFLPFSGKTYFSLRLFLRCTADQAQDLMKTRPEKIVLKTHFAVIAKVESVSRPADTGIHLEDEDTLDAKGLCVDLLYLEWLGKK